MEPEKLSLKSIRLWAGAAIVIAAVVIAAVKLASPGGGTDTGDGIVPGLEAVTDADWIRGATSSPVTLIEYSDFQCPACAAYFPLVERVIEDYKDSVRFVYRHFPLPQHLQAKPAAYTAEAAGMQGKFWEMHDLLFENQLQWAGKSDAVETFESYAQKLGLDMDRYRADVDSSKVSARVNEQYRSGVSATVNATPSFFLNGRKLKNPSSVEAFKQLIDVALA